VQARNTDGVILVTSDVQSPLHAELRRINVPTVVVDPAGVPGHEVPTVGAANWSGALAATEYLISLGHRRIGFIAGPRTLVCSRTRLDGYRAALEAAEIAVDPQLIVQGDFYHESGFKGAAELLSLANAPTAIFASSDQMALGGYEAVRQPLSDMGALAARTLLRLAGGERIESLRFELPTQLVVRDSTGPLSV
jgi:LacI family transcriptional regulator